MKEKIFGYNIRNCRGDLSVGVVTAKDIHEAKTILQDQINKWDFCDEIRDDEIQEICFDSDGVCELYYGT